MIKTFVSFAITVVALTLIGVEQIWVNQNLHYLVLIVISLVIWYYSQSRIVTKMEENSVILPGVFASIGTIAVISIFEWCVQTWYTIGKEIEIERVDLRLIFLITFTIPILVGVNVVRKNTYEIDDGSEQRTERKIEKEFWPGIIYWLFGSLWVSR